MSEEETTKGAKKGAKVEKGAPIEHTHPPKKKGEKYKRCTHDIGNRRNKYRDKAWKFFMSTLIESGSEKTRGKNELK